jgi:hypothetical protein
MEYVDYEYYKTLYGEKAIPEIDFNRLLWDTEREIDKATSGVDNVRKLKVAFPVNEEDAETVKRCVCALVEFLKQIEDAERNANSVGQYTERADGSLRGKVVSSVSAGNESISYAVGKTADTAISNAIKDLQSKDMAVYQFITSKLSGISDANGVNLLFAGRYPYSVKQ